MKLINWKDISFLPGFGDWDERPAARLIENQLYAVESEELDQEVVGAPWSWEPMTEVTEEDLVRLEAMPDYEWWE